ncbi:MAG: metal-dependent hydrolase [Nanoarchaeota archaeon]
MALAVTHIILTIAFLDIFRHYVFGLKKFPRYLLVVGGIAGLAPDLDVPLGWIIALLTGSDVNIHGFFTHSIFFALLFTFIGAIFHYKKNMKWAKIFYVIAVGWTFHIFLDCFYGMDSSKLFLWPYQILPTFCPRWDLYPYASSIDAIILVLWLIHEEIHHKIKCYF